MLALIGTTRNDDVLALPEPYRRFWDEARRAVPADALACDPVRTLAWGTDASFYRLVPKIVVKVRSEEEMVKLLGAAGRLGLPVTFRAAGTSLSGQAVSDSILLVLAGGWKRREVKDGGERIVLEPGVIGAEANAMLLPMKRKIGPDPASIGACMIGGIVANNASGMCCGTAQNSYRTLESLKLVLADGTRLDTAAPASRAAFAASHGQVLAGLSQIREEILADRPLADRIREKYRIKNTTGYGLNSLVDFHDPFEILAHLMVGSEGTLAFVSEVTFRTVEEHAHRASALMLFPDIEQAAIATQRLKSGPVAAAEIMDRPSLRSVEGKPGMPPVLGTLGPSACALLVETRAQDPGTLARQAEEIVRMVEGLPTLQPIAFTAVKAEFEKLWDVRRGVFPSIGAARKIGTTVVIEDVAFPIQRLAEGTVALQRLMGQHGYDEGVIFGHALDGNLHFVFTQGFDDPGEVARYGRFMQDVAEMVVRRFEGSLKGEHGTGRNMAPFVALEWGEKAHGMMRRVKALLDPKGLLNPGVILNDDPKAHLANLKLLPRAHDLVDRCTECGFCEPRCPSRNLTLTPRQRIVTRREIARLRATGEDRDRLDRFEEDWAYLGDETCAADGLCQLACPVSIDTGKLTKRLRADGRTAAAKDLAADVAEMVVRRFEGSLKGEHGTGRNMAPFVALEWGEKAHGMMRRVKALFDPKGLLNPGVILNDDPKAHLANLKPLPRAHDLVDRCTECGFCEPRCPSRNLTLTPRQRIVTRREIARLRASGEDRERLDRFEEGWAYLGDETCAADGLCQLACPAGIDTGKLTKRLRADGRTAAAKDLAADVAEHYAGAMTGLRVGLAAAGAAHAVLGTPLMSGLARAARAATLGKLPLWNPAMPTRARDGAFGDVRRGKGREVVYFPACVVRAMGPARGDPDGRMLHEAMMSLLAKAEYDVLFPRELSSLCCGLTFESKGFFELADAKGKELEAALLEASDGGRIPVLCDTSPCLYRMKGQLDPRLRLHEPVEFIHAHLMDRLRFERKPETIAVHVTCSSEKMGLSAAFRAVAEACAETVVIPAAGCCGFAGDKGFSTPELNRSALAGLRPALPPDCRRGYSNSRTCEIGLTLHGGIPYQSIVYLVDGCTSPRPSSS